MTDGQTDRQTDRQANRGTDNITINNIILVKMDKGHKCAMTSIS